MQSLTPCLPDVEISGANKHIGITHISQATWRYSFYVLHPLSLLLRNVLDFYTNTYKLFLERKITDRGRGRRKIR